MFSFVSVQVAHASLSDGLVLWLPMDEGTGSTAYDASGHANHGTVIANWTTGYNEGGLSFNGTTDYVIVPYNDDLHPESITLCAWVKLEEHTVQHIIIRPDTGDGYWLLVNNDTGKVHFGYRNANGSAWEDVFSTGSVTWGEWTFIYGGMVPDGESGEKRFVGINEDYEEFDAWESRRVDVAGNLRIGAWDIHYIKGDIDDVRVYNRALTETEITQLYTLYDEAAALPSLNVQWMWIYLFEGDFIGFFDTVLTTTFNNYSLAVAIIVLIFMAALYIRTSSFPLVCIAWLLIGGFLIVAMPIVSGLALIFCALGIGGGIIYRLFRPPS